MSDGAISDAELRAWAESHATGPGFNPWLMRRIVSLVDEHARLEAEAQALRGFVVAFDAWLRDRNALHTRGDRQVFEKMVEARRALLEHSISTPEDQL